MQHNVITRFAALGYTLRRVADGYELAITPPAVFGSDVAAAAWIQRREAERGRVGETKEPSMKRALDLFCKAGGATKGLQRAGYHVTGVDIEPQPRYCGDAFHQDDAMAWLRGEREPLASFDLIWASPPCQGYSKTQKLQGREHPMLIEDVRQHLAASGAPYIIENVPGAPLRNPVTLVGSLFGLRTMRPRLFECSFDVPFFLAPTPAARTAKMGRKPRDGEYMHVVGHFSDIDAAREAMGIEWMSRDELAEAIPPAYSEFLARHNLEAA